MLRRQFTKLLSATPLLSMFGFNKKEPDGSPENPYISWCRDITKFYVTEDEFHYIPLNQKFGDDFCENAKLADETVKMLANHYTKDDPSQNYCVFIIVDNVKCTRGFVILDANYVDVNKSLRTNYRIGRKNASYYVIKKENYERFGFTQSIEWVSSNEIKEIRGYV